MKRKIQRVCIALFVLGLVATLFAATEEYDYGKVRWGMTIEEVVKATGGGVIRYSGESGLFLLRVLAENKLHRNEYYLFSKKERRLESISGDLRENVTEQEVFQFLIKTYGRPIETNVHPQGLATINIVFVRGNTKAIFMIQDNRLGNNIGYSQYTK